MHGIGIRVYSNSTVYYTIIEENTDGNLVYKSIDRLYVPSALERPERLNFIRNTLLDIISEYKVTKAAIRIAEFGGTIDKNAIERLYLEGVIQEAFASSTVENFDAAQIARLCAVAGIERTDFKKLAKAEIDFEHFPEDLNWGNYSLEERESVLAAYTALKL